jgi:putative transposase
VKYLGSEVALDELFLTDAKRKVAKDRTVSLDGLVSEVDAALVGETVTLRLDASGPRRTVQVWHAGAKVHDAKVVDLYANCFVKRDRASAPSGAPTPGPTPSGLKRDDDEGR